MSIDSVNNLIETLCHERLLDEEQQGQLHAMRACFNSPQALAKHLVQSNWLTVYQVRHLFEGQGTRLVIGPYCIVDRLGEGGVSQVYKAWDGRKNRHVALKVMRQDLVSEEDAIRQFERELQAVTRLNHPNIIKTHDAGCCGASHYFAMEFVAGTDLGKVVHLSGALPITEACDYVRQVATGLQYAHTMNLVHRDIKPANLYLVHPPGHDAPTPGVTWKRPAEPIIKIIDWGLARTQLGAGGNAPVESYSTKKEEGMLIGTADFIAPEQARDPRLVDIRADIYSLGCTFYYLLTGQPPFSGTSVMQKLMQHQQVDPVPIQQLRQEIPDELAVIIRKMLAKSPEERYQIPLAVSVPLRRFCENVPTSLHGRRPGASANGGTLPPPPQGSTLRNSAQGGLLRRNT